MKKRLNPFLTITKLSAMTTNTLTSHLARFRGWLARHWFKTGLVALMLYAVFSKDLSFNISIQSPTQGSEQKVMPESTQRPARKETFTENSALTASTNRLDFLPDWGSADAELLQQLARIDDAERRAFIDRFAHVAQAEQEKYGVPASVILAYSMLYSRAGQAMSAQEGNNYFALPCTGDWEGATQQTANGTCVRRYDNAWMSFRDNSLFLTTGTNARLRVLRGQDYRAWASSLEDMPTNENDELGEQLVQIIEQLGLARWDD